MLDIARPAPVGVHDLHRRRTRRRSSPSARTPPRQAQAPRISAQAAATKPLANDRLHHPDPRKWHKLGTNAQDAGNVRAQWMMCSIIAMQYTYLARLLQLRVDLGGSTPVVDVTKCLAGGRSWTCRGFRFGSRGRHLSSAAYRGVSEGGGFGRRDRCGVARRVPAAGRCGGGGRVAGGVRRGGGRTSEAVFGACSGSGAHRSGGVVGRRR